MKRQAQTIYEALVKLDRTRQSEYQASLKKFLADIDGLDNEIRQTLVGVNDRKFMVFHPSWGYFASDYNLEMIPIEIGGQEPSAAELAELIAEAKKEGIRVIFVQPEFSTRAAETIANQIGGEVITIGCISILQIDRKSSVFSHISHLKDWKTGVKLLLGFGTLHY